MGSGKKEKRRQKGRIEEEKGKKGERKGEGRKENKKGRKVGWKAKKKITEVYQDG